MALTYLNSKMIEEPASFDQIYVISLTALSSTIQNTLTNDLTAINVTGDSVINVDTPGNALRITQRGIGNALVVEDSANTDSTPFVVNNLGRVGIGTTAPTTELDVNGTIKGNTILGSNVNVTGTGTFQTVDATGVTTRNVIFPQSGGGSIVNDAAFFGNLTIYGAISALSGLAVTSTSTSQTSSLSVVNTGPDVALFVSQGPNLSGVATFIGSGTEVLKVNNPNPNPNNLPAVVVNGALSASGNTFIGGSVGIGTSTPNAKLHVVGGGCIVQGGGLDILRTISDYNAVSLTNTGGVQVHLNANGNSEGNLRTVTNHRLSFSTNNTERMVIDTSGNVGIGTSSPTNLLTLHGVASGTAVGPTFTGGVPLMRINGSTFEYSEPAIDLGEMNYTATARIASKNTANGGGHLILMTRSFSAVNTQLTERMRIDGSGNVSIGTTNPNYSGYGQSNLTICSSNNQQGVLELVGNRADGNLFAAGDINFFAESNTTNKRIASIQVTTDGNTANNRGGRFTFYTKSDNSSTISSPRLVINSNGVIGIGGSAGMITSPWSGTSTIQMGATSISNLAYINGATVIATNGYFTSGDGITPTWRYTNPSGSNAGGSLYAQGYITGYHIWYTAPVGSTGAEMNWQERMRIHDNGNVGIGTSTPNQRLTVIGANSRAFEAGGENVSIRLASSEGGWLNAYKFLAFDGTELGAMTAGGSSQVIEYVGFNVAGSERMRIDSSGNVGIGTTAPNRNVETYVAAGGNAFQARSNTVTTDYGITSANDAALIYTRTNHPIVFGTNDIERMRITTGASGAAGLLIACSVNPSSTVRGFGINTNDSTGDLALVCSSGTLTTSDRQIAFINGNGLVGSIVTNGSGTAYIGTSDYRLKTNVQPIQQALNRVKRLKPCTFTWKIDNTNSEGFIAHELAEVCPLAVSGEKDAITKDGKIIPQGVDPGKVVALLTAAIQELTSLVQTQSTAISALENRIQSLETQ